MHCSHNLPFPPRIYPPPSKKLHATLTEFTLRPKIYPHFKHLRPSQNLPLPPRIGYPPFLTNYMRHFHNTPLPSRIYPLLYQVRLPESTSSFLNIPPFSTTICDAPRVYPTLPEPPPPPALRNATLPESTHPSSIYPHFTTICDTPIIDPSLP